MSGGEVEEAEQEKEEKVKVKSRNGNDFLSEQKVKKLRKWVEAQADIPPGYDAYVDHLLLDKDDPEVTQRQSLQSNKKLTFRYLLEKTHPAQNKFAPLSYGKLLKAFTFTTDPGVSGKRSLESLDKLPSSKRRKVTGEVDMQSDISDDDATGEKNAETNQQLLLLQKDLLKAVEGMIRCKWPKNLKSHVDGFKLMGFPSGNPFAVVLERNGWIPDDYFEIIKEPIDLATIKNRVQDLYYDDLETFERQVRLVISNAFQYNIDEKSVIHKMAKIQRKKVEDELNKLKKRIAKSR